MVFGLVAGHPPFAEGVPRVETGVGGDALEAAASARGGVSGDLAVGKQGVVDELPLVPGDVAAFAFVDFLVLEIVIIGSAPFRGPTGSVGFAVFVSVPTALLPDEGGWIAECEDALLAWVGCESHIALVDGSFGGIDACLEPALI